MQHVIFDIFGRPLNLKFGSMPPPIRLCFAARNVPSIVIFYVKFIPQDNHLLRLIRAINHFANGLIDGPKPASWHFLRLHHWTRERKRRVSVIPGINNGYCESIALAALIPGKCIMAMSNTMLYQQLALYPRTSVSESYLSLAEKRKSNDLLLWLELSWLSGVLVQRFPVLWQLLYSIPLCCERHYEVMVGRLCTKAPFKSARKRSVQTSFGALRSLSIEINQSCAAEKFRMLSASRRY